MRHRGVQHGGEVFLLDGFVVQQGLRNFYELNDLTLLVVEIYVELLDHKELRGLFVRVLGKIVMRFCLLPVLRQHLVVYLNSFFQDLGVVRINELDDVIQRKLLLRFKSAGGNMFVVRTTVQVLL